jgi:hypothetical protein
MRANGMRFDLEAGRAVERRYKRHVARLERYVERMAEAARQEELESARDHLLQLPSCSVHTGYSKKCPECAAVKPHRKERLIVRTAIKSWGRKFNSASPQEWEWLLVKVRKHGKHWTKRGLTDGGRRSMKADVLLGVLRRIKAAGGDEPLIRARLRIVRLQKRLGTYLSPIIDSGTDRINPVYNDARTTSGRWSGGGSFEETA